MQVIHAQMTAKDNEMVVETEPIQVGNIKYCGCKIVHLKQVEYQDENGNKKAKQVIDDSKADEYDSLSQIFHDVDNSKESLSNIIVKLAQSKMLNANLITQLAEQKKINADIISSIAKLGGSKQ